MNLCCKYAQKINSINDLLINPQWPSVPEESLHQEQRKDLKLAVLINYLENGVFSKKEKEARKYAATAT